MKVIASQVEQTIIIEHHVDGAERKLRLTLKEAIQLREKLYKATGWVGEVRGQWRDFS